MSARVGCWAVAILSAAGWVGCIDEPVFHQVGENEPASTGDAATSQPAPSGDAAPSGANDDDPMSYVPDGGVAGPGTMPCGPRVCAVGNVCCKGKCKKLNDKC